MNFNVAEIEVLKLAGWCKALPQELERFSSPMLSPAGIEALCSLKLLRADKRGSLRLTPAGMDFLHRAGFSFPRDSAYVSHPDKLERRSQNAQILFTFYRAGIPVFAKFPVQLSDSPIFLSAAAARRNEELSTVKVWEGCRMAGIARLGDTAHLIHYLDEKGVQFSSEMKLFRNLIAGRCELTACIYATPSYTEAAKWILSKAPSLTNRRGGWVSFRDACKRTSMPVHLMECSNTGSIQLAVMHTLDYRERIARLVLTGDYQPPPPALPDADAMLEGLPLVTAVDMDVKRIGRAYRESHRLGLGGIQIVALTEQLNALTELFQPLGVSEFYDIKQADLTKAMRLSLYEPSTEQYRTPEGGVLSAADIPPRPKAGRPPKQKA